MQRVLVAMSGGVDSSVTAYLLKAAGYDCIGATMLLSGGCAGPSSCGAASEADDAAAVCGRLGIPWHALDMRATFADTVIDKFVRTYEAGRTPNPCIDCNRHLKFGALLDHARAEGCDFIATGHYGRTGLLADMPVLDGPAAGLLDGISARCGGPERVHALRTGIDPTKDQSYVLYSLTQERLGRVLLPLGELRKEADVRRIAREQGFENAGKRDSQGICFVPDDDFASYIETRRGQALPEGDIVDAAGNVLGRHRGAIRYTIGQRKGLGVACAHPVYVTAIDAAANTVTLGDPEDLMATGLVADDWIWSAPADAMEELLDEAGATGLPAGAKIRYHHPTRACRMRRGADGSIELAFDEAERGIAPGQAVVAYAGDVVLGGGTVVRALR